MPSGPLRPATTAEPMLPPTRKSSGRHAQRHAAYVLVHRVTHRGAQRRLAEPEGEASPA